MIKCLLAGTVMLLASWPVTVLTKHKKLSTTKHKKDIKLSRKLKIVDLNSNLRHRLAMKLYPMFPSAITRFQNSFFVSKCV